MAEPPSAASPHGENGGPGDWPDDRWPDGDWPDDDWPDGDWPDDDWPGGDWPDDTWPGDQPAAGGGGGPPPPPRGTGPPAKGPSAAPSASTPRGLPSIPSQRIGGGGVSGGQPGGVGGQVQMLLAGPVTAVSSTSITVAGQGNSVTGAVTSATKVTGKVTSISGIRVGDRVLVKFTGNPASGSFIATTIQDPASIS
jgi:hypothetical protein